MRKYWSITNDALFDGGDIEDGRTGGHDYWSDDWHNWLRSDTPSPGLEVATSAVGMAGSQIATTPSRAQPPAAAGEQGAPPGALTVAQALAAYQANPNMKAVAVADTASNVSQGLDALQFSLTSNGKLISITLTDPVAQLSVNSNQANYTTLAFIVSSYGLIVTPSPYGQDNGFSYVMPPNVYSVSYTGQGDNIFGNTSFNTITTNVRGSSIIHAGSGGSYIVTNGGFVTQLYGGSGGNTIYSYSDGINEIYGGIGSPSDVLVVSGSFFAKIYGGTGNNYIVGSRGQGILVGGGGINTIYGNAIAGGQGDYIVGGTGPSNTLVENGTGNASIWGGAGSNYMVGGVGDDLLVGKGSSDYIFGGDGKDTIYAGNGTDYIYPGNGNDFIWTDDIGSQSTDYIYEQASFGVDTIADFTPGDGANHDVLVFSGTNLHSFADIKANTVQAGVYTVISSSLFDQVYLYNVQPFQLTANDFIFG